MLFLFLCPFLIVTVTLMIFLFLVVLLLLFIFLFRFVIIVTILHFLFGRFFAVSVTFFLVLFIPVVYNVLTIASDKDQLLFFLKFAWRLFLISAALIILSLISFFEYLSKQPISILRNEAKH